MSPLLTLACVIGGMTAVVICWVWVDTRMYRAQFGPRAAWVERRRERLTPDEIEWDRDLAAAERRALKGQSR